MEIADNNDHDKGTGSSKIYKEWDTQDVSSWLRDQVKLPQYCETFCKCLLNPHRLSAMPRASDFFKSADLTD